MASVLETRKKLATAGTSFSTSKTEVQDLLNSKNDLECLVQDKIKIITAHEMKIQDLQADVCIYKSKFEKADELNKLLQEKLIRLIGIKKILN